MERASERAALCSADLKYSKWSEETKLGDASEQIRGRVFSCWEGAQLIHILAGGAAALSVCRLQPEVSELCIRAG